MSRLKVGLLIFGVLGAFLVVFFATFGVLVLINRQGSVQLQTAVAFSQIVVGIAEGLIALGIGAEAVLGGYSFLKRERKEHYEKINDKVLKQLSGIRPEAITSAPEDRLRDYKLGVGNFPDNEYLSKNAWLHIKQEDASAYEALRTLRASIKEHNQRVDSTQYEIMNSIQSRFPSHEFATEPPTAWAYNLQNTIIPALFSFWKEHLELVRSRDGAQLLGAFNSVYSTFYDSNGLFLQREGRGNSVWPGTQQKGLEIFEIMKGILVDPVILRGISEVENSKSTLIHTITKISEVATRISNAIDAGDYVTVVDCCPSILGF